tara:strand:+ start:5061 stop:5417 length:357 start_codon:yes stop_codon:yes gene_type:complete
MSNLTTRESVENLDLNHEFTIKDESYDLNHDFILSGIAYGNYVTEEVAASIQKDIDDHFTGEYAEYDVLQLALCTNSAYASGEKLGEINKGQEWLFNNQEYYCLTFSDSDTVLLLTKE